METNQALAKAAEEKTKGLAKEAPIQATKADRRNVGTAERKTAYESLRDELTDEEQLAMYRLSRGRLYLNLPNRLKTSSFVRIGGYSEEEYQRDLMDSYTRWCNWMVIQRMIDCRTAVINLCCEMMSFSEAAIHSNVSDKTVKQMAVKGVKEYVQANEDSNRSSLDMYERQVREQAISIAPDKFKKTWHIFI